MQEIVHKEIGLSAFNNGDKHQVLLLQCKADPLDHTSGLLTLLKQKRQVGANWIQALLRSTS